MDKSKSRTDLLAAGRKKLQQFRQKKDGKGSGSSSSSHGKSSNKHGKVDKHDVNADSVSSDDRRSESSHFTGDEAGQQHGNSSLTKVDSSVSLSVDDVTHETDANESDRSSVIVRHETDVDDVACKSELPVNEADPGRLNSSATTEVLVSELDSVQSSQLPTADSDGQATDAKVLHHEHDHPNISLVGTRGHQFVDSSLSEEVEKYDVAEEPPGILDVDTVIPDIQVKATEAVVNGSVPRGTSKTWSYELLQSNSSPSVSTPEEIGGTTDNISQNVEVKDGHPIHEIFVQANEELLADEGNTLEFEHKNELPLELFRMPDVDGSPVERVSTTLNEVEASNLTRPSASETSPPELENHHPMNLLSAPVALIAETADSNSLDIETKDKLPQRNLPDLSLVQAREDQVTDLGTMQERDYLGPEHLASSNEIEVVEDKKHHEGASFSASIRVLGTGNNDIPVSVIDPPSLSVTTAEVSGHTRRDAITLNDGSAQMLSDVSDVGRLEGSQGDGTIQAVDIGISIDQYGSSRLLQLVNYLKGLNEDEFRYLIKLRNSDVQAISGDTDISSEPNHGIADVLDAYKEQIYVANVSKDVFNVQLLEQSKLQVDADHMRQQLDDKVSKLEVSLKECNERNQTLDEELSLCRSELSTNMKNIEELSSAVQEWQDKFYRSQEDLSIVSKDLHDCRCMVDTIQMEKQKLSESLKSMLNESNQYVEEKENTLKENEKLLLELRDLKSQLAESASLTDNLNSVTEDKRKLDEERESVVQENTIILSELADCKNLLADVQAKHASASESIISLTEEKDRHDLQKHSFMLAHEKMTAEMTECNNHLAYLEAENLKLSANISSAAEEKKKLEEEKRHLLHELEVLSSENHAIQEALLLARAGIIDHEAEKNKVNLWLEQMIEENIFLHSCLEVLKSKIREISDKSREGLNESRHSITTIDASSSVVDISISGIANTHLQHDGFSFAVMKGHVDTAERAIHNLDKAIDALDTQHSYPKDDETSANGVSKLIQTFESKEFYMDHEEGETPSSVDEYAVSHLRLIKEQAHIVKAVLKQLCLDAENAYELFMVGSENRVKADAAFNGSDARYIAIQEHAENLEGYSIELEVQNEALKENLRSILGKNCETVTLNEKLQNRQLTLESENNKISEKLKGYYLRVTDMGNQMLEIKDHLGEMAPSIINQIKNMQMETAEEVSRFENHWNSAVTQIIGFLGRLDSFSTGLLTSADPTVTRADLEIAKRVSSSVDSAVSFMQKVQDDFEALKSEYQSLDSLYKEVHGRYTNLLEENAASVDILHKVHGSLRSLVIGSCSDVSGSGLYIEPDLLLDPSQINDYKMLIEQLSRSLHEKMQLGSENAKLHSVLDNISKEMEEINRSSHDMHVMAELVEHVERKLKLATLETDCNIPLTSRLEKCISSLLQAHEEVNELQSLRWSLSRAEEELSGVRSELQKKVAELEQSEQRVSSIREKLSIAVAKGKGLIVQRDNLKQSLAEASSELEKSRQQLQLSESRLLEAETKLKTYAEAGERVEALESELSYIRNSATALRESFLLKDSVLQRIEEILEDLELPEHLHSREIIDKVDWLARSVVGNSNVLPATDWDQKSTPEGGSYSDNGFVVMDAWKDDTQHNSSSYDDLQRKHEELQNKFYGLAEQNEMLEQSLTERNNVVQRLEEVLDKINMPSHLRSIEAESRIEWLGGALSDAHQRSSTLQERIDHLETHCEKLTAELEESQRSCSDIKSVLEITIRDKEGLQSSLADITRNMEYVQETAATLELKNNKMQIEIDGLQEKLDKNKDYISETENGIKSMLVLICTALQYPSLNESSVGYDLLYLEEILRKLIDDHARLSVVNSTSRELDESAVGKADSTPGESGEMTTSDHDGSVMNSLKKELEEALGNLTHVEEERDSYMEKYQSLCNEIEAMRKRSEELQLLLSQEEQKSASLREKLNVAVRKGKSLVQQRDSLKQSIEELNIKVDNMTSEINHHRSTIAQYEEKCKDLSSYLEIIQASESENQMLRSQLSDTERYLHEERYTVSLMLNTLNDIKVNGGFNSNDPLEKLQQLGKAYGNMLASKASSDQESVKSKKAAELLLAELNEVQERNDGLQDELSKVADEVSDLLKANKSLEAAKAEALSQLAKLSASQKEEQKKQNTQLVELKSGVDQLRKYFEDIILLLADVFSMDMEFFKSLELCLNASDGTYVYGRTLFKEHDDNQKAIFNSGIPLWEELIASYSWLTCKTPEQFGNAMDDICGYIEHQVRDCTSKINYVKEKLQSYQILKTQEATRVSTKLRSVQGEIASRIKSLEKEREIEKGVLLKNITLLYEACADSIREVGNKKAIMSRDNPSFMDIELNVGAAETEEGHFFMEEHIRALSVRLTTAVKDLSNIEDETGKADRLEMKNTIANLQKEIQEKDIQRERICMELAGQIKRAEAAATNYSRDLELATAQVHDLERQLNAIGKENNSLEQKRKELEDEKTASVELQERVRSMTGMLSAKDQEIESLMQALDEEESEMEEMSNKVEQMEEELQQKNKELVKLEAAHNKALKKLSVTVSKFDELHDLSADLLAEVEKLQLQIQERDEEVSFLRQEVTRCTNDILLASQSKKNSDEIIELFEWLKTETSRVDLMGSSPKDMKMDDAHVYKESIQNLISHVISELEDLRHVAESRNELLQAEKNKVQELIRRGESLETALRQKEAQLNLLEEAPASSENRGIEPLENNNWVISGLSTSSQVRSLRKSNNDQVAIAVEDDPATSRKLEDEDEDKVHGFKSLTTSRIVPRFTRPVSDMIDGLWVSCDRALMRQPALRLAIILYWALLHSLLAAFVV